MLKKFAALATISGAALAVATSVAPIQANCVPAARRQSGAVQTEIERDTVLFSACAQSPRGKLVNANITPNRCNVPNEMFEIISVTFGNSGWLIIKNHENQTASRNVSFDVVPLGLNDSSKPLYNWCFTLRDSNQCKGIFSKKERKANYCASRWASDFLLGFEYLGKQPYSQRISQDFEVSSKELKLWYVTQSPALVWSVDEMRLQLLLDNTMGVRVTGSQNGNSMTLTVDSERKNAEVAALIPERMYVKNVTVNGKKSAWAPAVDANTRLALINVAEGKSDIKIDFAFAAGRNRALCRLEVKPAAPGKDLTIALTPALESATLVISKSGDMVWAKQGASATITLPRNITGGTYTASAYDAGGNLLASQDFTLSNGTPAIGK